MTWPKVIRERAPAPASCEPAVPHWPPFSFLRSLTLDVAETFDPASAGVRALELVVVDDASTEDTVAPVLSYLTVRLLT
jgi:hypothetical protein